MSKAGLACCLTSISKFIDGAFQKTDSQSWQQTRPDGKVEKEIWICKM